MNSACLDTRPYICKFALEAAPGKAPPPPHPGALLSPPPPGFLYGTATNASYVFGAPFTYDGVHEFMYFNTPMTWDDAASACVYNQADLATFDSLAEWEAVVAHFEPTALAQSATASMWFGLQVQI